MNCNCLQAPDSALHTKFGERYKHKPEGIEQHSTSSSCNGTGNMLSGYRYLIDTNASDYIECNCEEIMW